MNTIAIQLGRIIDELEMAVNDNDIDRVESLIKELEVLKEDMENDFPMLNSEDAFGADWED